jgi:hypothetical protein
MKTIYLILAIVLILGCKKEEIPPTTYQVINGTSGDSNSTVPYLDGTLYEIVVYQYSGGDIIQQDNIEPLPPRGGTSERIEANPTTDRIKVSFKFLPPQSLMYNDATNYRRYVVSLTILTPRNNLVIIDDNTMLSGILKSVQTFNRSLDSVSK